MDGWVGGWMDGWMDGLVEAKAGLRIAYSNQQIDSSTQRHHRSNDPTMRDGHHINDEQQCQ